MTERATISLTTFGFDFFNQDLAESLAGFDLGGLYLLLGNFTGFLFDVLDDGVDDVANLVPRHLRYLEVVGEEIVNSFDGGVNNLGTKNLRFDNRFEDGLETGIELVSAKDSGQKQSDAGD